nr:RnfABCDGE type electron transport complex subunit D [Anaerotalea alkaliphila]
MISSSPHIRSKDSTQNIMGYVILALLPATAVGVYNFGFKALINILICIIASVAFEAGVQKLLKKEFTIRDNSAALTGLLLALNLPPAAPVFIGILGSFFAIVIVKQIYGGIGMNIVNPALAARAFLLVSYAEIMTAWEVDGVSSATPLAMLKDGSELPAVGDAFLGMIGGSIGEVSAIAILIGGIFLIVKKIISYRIPFYFILSTALMVLLFGGRGFDLSYLGYHLFSGGLMLGAFFMATDYVTSPMTPKGQIIMGVGCGIITALVRLFGGYPEGVSFAILIMNLFVPIIDRYTIPRAFGEVAK